MEKMSKSFKDIKRKLRFGMRNIGQIQSQLGQNTTDHIKLIQDLIGTYENVSSEFRSTQVQLRDLAQRTLEVIRYMKVFSRNVHLYHDEEKFLKAELHSMIGLLNGSYAVLKESKQKYNRAISSMRNMSAPLGKLSYLLGMQSYERSRDHLNKTVKTNIRALGGYVFSTLGMGFVDAVSGCIGKFFYPSIFPMNNFTTFILIF